jgi:mevalonate kinase
LVQESYRVGGKVFVLGEYAVLSGAPALVATVPPQFGLTVVREIEEGDQFHFQSPLARLKDWASQAGLPELSFKFEDPLQGRGGFGASTAQFAMGFLAYAQRMPNLPARRWKQVWKLYRELMVHPTMTPSGADLVAQWQGGVIFFDPSEEYCLDVWPLFDWSNLLVFSATHQKDRKVPTHDHLELLSQQGFLKANPGWVSSLESVILDGISAVRENDVLQLGRSMDDYAEILCRADLETPRTTEDRLMLRELPGVCGVKGAGALQSDAILVMMQQKGFSERNAVIQAAISRGLRLVSDGLTCEMGVSCQIR